MKHFALHPYTAARWALPCVLAFTLASCTKEHRDTQSKAVPHRHGLFELALDSNQVVIDSISVDLNADGVNECVLTVGQRPAGNVPAHAFSVLHVYEFRASDSSWHSIFSDAVESGEVLYLRDITGSGSPEVVAELNAGGNDPVSSRGMQVYGFRADDVFTLLFYSASGNPEIRDLNDDGVDEILVSGEYWGIASRSDVFIYTEAVYAFNGDAYRIANTRFAKYYNAEIAKKAASFNRETKHAARGGDPEELYRASMDMLLWTAAKGGNTACDAFWSAHKGMLEQLLPEELYDELEYFVEEEKAGFKAPLAEQRT